MEYARRGRGSLADLFPLLRHSLGSICPPSPTRSKDTLSSVSWEQERTSVLSCVGAGVRHACRVPPRRFFPPLFLLPSLPLSPPPSLFFFFFFSSVHARSCLEYLRKRICRRLVCSEHAAYTTLSIRVVYSFLAPETRTFQRGLDGDIGSRYVFIDALIGGGFVSKAGYRVPAYFTFPRV